MLTLPRLEENILLNFEFTNEATRANLQVNKRILEWQPFWNKVYKWLPWLYGAGCISGDGGRRGGGGGEWGTECNVSGAL